MEVKDKKLNNSPSNLVSKSTQQSSSKKIGEINVEIKLGDMTKDAADAYVVTQFTNSMSEASVANNILEAGAVKGMTAFDRYVRDFGPLEFRDIKITESGGGNSNFLIHFACLGASKEQEFSIIKDTVAKAIKLADRRGNIKSISMPSLSAGKTAGYLTPTQSAKAILAGIHEMRNKVKNLNNIKIYIFQEPGYLKDFCDVLNSDEYEYAKTEIGESNIEIDKFKKDVAKNQRKSRDLWRNLHKEAT